ncbi:hypothetical protein QR721_13565 [Aciduricibacillus chroicocephali]|uniref:Uncharacterized protein n=1 Tax=Aciduricibacillus chroicocephali TaxID=3054939 RepID=A0ABY9KVN3_9BACI|nr:hypothetical protein QR721_13565 [Bacillaceae bacterium 44XB]
MRTDKRAVINVLPFTSNAEADSLCSPNAAHSKQRFSELQHVIDGVLVKGVDYGLINGYSKPTLLKPGAEKLCDVFGFAKGTEVVNRIERWDDGIFAYEVKVTLTQKDSGVIESEGLGSCNSKESAFHHQDPYTIVNNILKMAKKRALIDAVLSATQSSGIFTQDIEDFSKTNNISSEESVTKVQLQKIFQLVDQMRLPTDVAKEMMKMYFAVERSTQLTKEQAAKFIEDLLILKDARDMDEDHHK